MKNIAQRQNEEHYLKIQYAARKLFNDAENLGYLIWGLYISSTVLGMISNKNTPIAVGIIILSFEILAWFIDKKRIRNILYAADLRAMFDHYVLGIKAPETQISKELLLEKAENIKQKNYKKYLQQTCNTGKENPPGVRDWYDTEVDISQTRSPAYYIFKENIWWTTKMTNAKRNLSIILFITAITVVIIFSINQPLAEIIWLIVGIIGLIMKLLDFVIVSCNYHKLSVKINSLLSEFDNFKDDTGIISIQTAITEQRRLPIVQINLFHKIKALAYHYIYREVNKKQ